MAEGFLARLAVEAAFLILVAVGLGLADLRPAIIIGVMAGAWLLVSLIEWLAWRARPVPGYARFAEPAAPPPPPGWNVEEILVPADERAAYAAPEPEPEPAVEPAEPEPVEPLTSVLSVADEEPLGGEAAMGAPGDDGNEPAPDAAPETESRAEPRGWRGRLRRGRGAQ